MFSRAKLDGGEKKKNLWLNTQPDISKQKDIFLNHPLKEY